MALVGTRWKAFWRERSAHLNFWLLDSSTSIWGSAINSANEIRTNNFDLLRLIAAVQVVVVHGLDHLRPIGSAIPSWQWIVESFPGVPIFFAISGFLISLSYERSGDLKTYFQNRALRIYPGLWMCVAFSIASVAVLSPTTFQVGIGHFAVWVLSQLSIGQFYNPVWLRQYGVGVLNGSLWTIPVELQFYLILPVIYHFLGLAHRRGTWGLALLLLLCWLRPWQFAGVHAVVEDRFFAHTPGGAQPSLWYKLLGVTFIPYVYLFILGILIQRNWQRIAPWIAGRWPLWLVAYVGVALGLHRLGLTVGTNTPTPISVPFLLALVFSLAYSAPTLADRILRRHDFSYGIYIYHMPVLNAFMVLGLAPDRSAIVPILGMTFLLAAASWVIIERPALRRKRQTLHAPTSSLAA